MATGRYVELSFLCGIDVGDGDVDGGLLAGFAGFRFRHDDFRDSRNSNLNLKRARGGASVRSPDSIMDLDHLIFLQSKSGHSTC